MIETQGTAPHPISINVVEPRTKAPRGSVRCEMGENVAFSTASLESYFFGGWEPAAYDALLVAAAVEFADKIQRRPAYSWARNFELRIPVHDLDRWNERRVKETLLDVLNFLTGDHWNIEFYSRAQSVNAPRQGLLSLSAGVDAVIPFSNGLDSCAVAGLMVREMGQSVVRIRLGSRLRDGETLARQGEAFTSVPYRVTPTNRRFVESTARSRGFKFALISGLAAYLAKAGQVIVPESGQGALGPTLVPVGQAYEDYRSHPLFTTRMERFLQALLDYRVRYVFPQLWCTKAETLKRFVNECRGDTSWLLTWSCWQQNRHVGVDHKKRQCGICAACMLRRLSVHAAGLSEPRDRYVWEDLSVPTLWDGVAPSFDSQKITDAMREYAIAGVLHLDHLAGLLDSSANTHRLNLSALLLGGALELPESAVREKLERLLQQHATEWKSFVASLGKTSFVADWALSAL